MSKNIATRENQKRHTQVSTVKAHNLTSDFFLPSLSNLDDFYGSMQLDKKKVTQRTITENCIITLMFQCCGGRI